MRRGSTPGSFDDVWEHVDKSGECWLWTGARVRGYGAVRIAGVTRYAHRVTFELSTGREPRGVVMHLCDNPPCVRPEHLVDGTQADNLSDAAAKARMSWGERRPNHKVTLSQVREMRRLHDEEGLNGRQLAERFPLAERTIRKILSGRNWRHD